MQSRLLNRASLLAAVGCACGLGLVPGLAYAGKRATTASKAPYEVAVPASLTGAGAVGSIPGVDGVKAAIAFINSTGGVKGHKLHMTVYDDQSSPSLSPGTGQAAVGSHPVVIMDTAGSITITPRLPIYESAQLPNVTEGLNSSFPWYYQIIPTSSQNDRAIVSFAEAGLHVKTLAGKTVVFITADTAGGHLLGSLIGPLITAAGGKLAFTNYSPLGAATFTGGANVIAAHPDEVILADSATDDLLEAKTLRGLGYSGPIVVNFAGGGVTTMQQAPSGYSAEWFAPLVLKKTDVDYKWAKKLGFLDWASTPQFPSFFSAMYYVAQALRNCKYPCPPAALEKQITRLGPIQIRGGAFGTFGVKGNNHSLIRNFEVWTYANGKFVNVNGKNALPISLGPPDYGA